MGEGDNMKRSLFKILTIAICIVTMLNIVLPSVSYVVYADDTNTTEAQKEETRATEGYESGFGQIMITDSISFLA